MARLGGAWAEGGGACGRRVRALLRPHRAPALERPEPADRAPSACLLLHLIQSESLREDSPPLSHAPAQEGLLSSCFPGVSPKAHSPGCGQDSSFPLTSLRLAGVRAFPQGEGLLVPPAFPRGAHRPGAEGRGTEIFAGACGRGLRLWLRFSLSFSTFPPRGSGCFPNMAAKVNGNPHSAPVRSVPRRVLPTWL